MKRFLFVLMVMVLGCSEKPMQDNFYYSLKEIPLSNEIKLHLNNNHSIENEMLNKFFMIDVAIQVPSTRAEASAELYSLWESDPSNFLWIDLLITYEYWFSEDIKEVLSTYPALNNNNSIGNYTKARWDYGYGSRGEFYQKAWEQKEELNPIQLLWLTLKYSNVLYDKGNIQQAINLLLNHTAEASLHGGRLLESVYWTYISEFMFRGDHLDDALHACYKSWALAEGNHSLQTNCSITLATILEARQEFTPALNVLDQCIADAKEFNLPWLASLALNTAAGLCDNISQPKLALYYDKQNYEINLKIKNTLNIPRNLMNIAYDMRLLGELDSCLVYMDKAKIWVDKYDEPSNKFGLPMHMAEYYCQIGDYSTADSLLSVALEQLGRSGLAHDEAGLHLKMIQQGLEMNQPDIAYRSISRLEKLQNALHNKMPDQNLAVEYEIATADFLAGQGEFKLASEAHIRAEKSIEKHNTENWEWKLLNSKGSLAILRNDQKTALSIFNDCLSIAKNRQDPDLISTSKLSLGKLLINNKQYNDAIVLFTESEDNKFGGRFKTRLNTLLYEGIAYSKLNNNEKALEVINKALDLCNKYSPVDVVAKLLIERAKIQPTSAKRDLLQASSLIQNSIQKEMPNFNPGILHDIAVLLAGLEYDKEGNDKGANSLLAALGAIHNITRIDYPDYDLIYYLTSDDRSFRWFITNQKVVVTELPNRKKLNRLIESILANPSQETDLLPSGLSGKLCIIPDGHLSALPWYAMSTPESAMLIDKVVLVEVPYWTQLKTDHVKSKQLNLLSIGVNKSEGQRLLKEAESEAIAIGEIWGDQFSTVLIGEKANLGNNPESILSQYQIIHIASHAKVHQGVPSRSTLRLAGNNSVPLTIPTVASMNLDAELVYLSSCEAARDVSTTGAIANFANAFLNAGVRSVIASSVPVDDNAGKLLAEKFYLNWKTGIPKSEALKQSLLGLRNNPKLENPRFWGYVKIYGDY
jgi:hypothetical protein